MTAVQCQKVRGQDHSVSAAGTPYLGKLGGNYHYGAKCMANKVSRSDKLKVRNMMDF